MKFYSKNTVPYIHPPPQRAYTGGMHRMNVHPPTHHQLFRSKYKNKNVVES